MTAVDRRANAMRERLGRGEVSIYFMPLVMGTLGGLCVSWYVYSYSITAPVVTISLGTLAGIVLGFRTTLQRWLLFHRNIRVRVWSLPFYWVSSITFFVIITAMLVWISNKLPAE